MRLRGCSILEKPEVKNLFWGRNPLLDEKKLKKTIDIIKSKLQKNNFVETAIIPPFKSIINFPFQDITNIYTFFRYRGNSLLRGSIFPSFYEKIYCKRNQQGYLLYKLFYKNLPLSPEEISKVFSEIEITELICNYILVRSGDLYFSLLKITPCEGYSFISSIANVTPGEFVYLGWDSLVFAKYLRDSLHKESINRCLDLCTGSGIQSVIISPFCKEIIASDVNPNTPILGRANAYLNGVANIDFIISDLFAKIEGKFDLITINPPYVFLPAPEETTRCGYGGENLGMDITLKIFEQLNEYMTEKGSARMITASPVINGKEILIEAIRKKISKKKLAFKFKKLVSHVVHEQLIDFHRSHNISHFTFFIIEISWNKEFSLTLEKADLLSAFFGWQRKYQTLLYWWIKNRISKL